MTDPRHTFELRGHEEAENVFRTALASGRLHHAWLISGPAGIGKATLAFRLARLLLNGEDPNSPAGRRITAATHGDLLEISRAVDEKKDVCAEKLRLRMCGRSSLFCITRRPKAAGVWLLWTGRSF